MDLRQIEQVVKDSKGGVTGKKEAIATTLATPENMAKSSIDSGKALQLFLDHIPIGSIPDIVINNPLPEVEVKTTDTVGSVIRLLHDKNLNGAPIVDKFDSELERNYSEEYIGLIDLGSIILWFLQEYDNSQDNREDHACNVIKAEMFFSMLEQNPPIAQTKVAELAKLFLWDPFFPIHADDSLFHVLLLLSKHRLQVVPITENSNSKVIGFVSQDAVIRALLESSGLEWFDSIADKALSEFRLFENEHAIQIYGDQSMIDAIRVLWENRTDSIAVAERETEMLIGSIRISDISLLIQDDNLYSNRKNLKVEQFIQLDATGGELDSTAEGELSEPSQKGKLNWPMISPVTNRKTDTLKKAMKNLAETKSNSSFLIDDNYKVQGLVTLRDIMVQFAPPCMDSRIGGGGFFESALKQTGCHVNEGTIVCDQRLSS